MEQPKKAGRPKGSKNKPKPRVELIPPTIEIQTNPEYKHLRPAIDASHKKRRLPLGNAPVVEAQPVAAEKAVPKRSSTDRKAKKSQNFLKESQNLVARFRRAQSVSGECQSQGCVKPSQYISRSGPRYKRFCSEHARANADTYPDLVDKFGIPFLNHPGEDRVLFIDRKSWRFVERDSESFNRDSELYVPFTPTRASAFIHFEMMDDAFRLASLGTPADKIWGFLCGNFVAPLPLKLESQFRDLLHEYCAWKVLDLEFQLKELGFPAQKRNWGITCHCCFADRQASGSKVLVSF